MYSVPMYFNYNFCRCNSVNNNMINFVMCSFDSRKYNHTYQQKISYSFYIWKGKQIQRWLTWSYNNVGHLYLICRVWHLLLNVFWNFMKKVLSLSFNRTYCHNFLTLCFLIFYLFIFNGLVIFFLTFSSLFRPCAYTTI